MSAFVAILRDGNCWKKKLPLLNGRVDPSTPSKAFIKVMKPDIVEGDVSSTKKNQESLVLVGSILLGSSVFLNFLFTTILAYFLSHNRHAFIPTVLSILKTIIRPYTYEELKEATDEFKEELGRGSFGIVYKGVFPTNTRSFVAVKKLDKLVQRRKKNSRLKLHCINWLYISFMQFMKGLALLYIQNCVIHLYLEIIQWLITFHWIKVEPFFTMEQKSNFLYRK